MFQIFGFWIRELIDKIVLIWFSRMFAFMIALFLSLPKRQRMSHNNGIAAQGWLNIVDNPAFPEHDFFEKGAGFPVTIRHASATFLDDAMNCIRSISVKFSHNRFESPFDLEMNSGEMSLFWSAASFMQFAKLRKEKWGVEYVEYNRQYPEGMEGAKGAVRRHPNSFHGIHYYAKTPFLFVGKDKIKRYAKYRVIPFEHVPESGKEHNISDWDMSNQRILPHETRGRNYLKYEYEDRIRSTGAKYRLQIQIRIANDDDDDEVFNNMVVWNEVVHPWCDLATFHIDKMLDWKESCLTTFSVNNMPKTLGVLPAKSIYDYNSLNYMRKHSEIARKARMFSYKIFGMVPPIPDNDNRNSEDWGA